MPSTSSPLLLVQVTVVQARIEQQVERGPLTEARPDCAPIAPSCLPPTVHAAIPLTVCCVKKQTPSASFSHSNIGVVSAVGVAMGRKSLHQSRGAIVASASRLCESHSSGNGFVYVTVPEEERRPALVTEFPLHISNFFVLW